MIATELPTDTQLPLEDYRKRPATPEHHAGYMKACCRSVIGCRPLNGFYRSIGGLRVSRGDAKGAHGTL